MMILFMSSTSSFQKTSSLSLFWNLSGSNNCHGLCRLLFLRLFVLMVIITTTTTTTTTSTTTKVSSSSTTLEEKGSTTSTAFVSSLEIRTIAKSKLSSHNLQTFLATPSNWPKIDPSSSQVLMIPNNGDPTIPMNEGDIVTEFFLFNLLSVQWTCVEKIPLSSTSNNVVDSSNGSIDSDVDHDDDYHDYHDDDDTTDDKRMSLLFSSPDGIPGIANDVYLRFDIESTNHNNNNSNPPAPTTTIANSSSSELKLTMGYNPLSPIAILAVPILIIDTWIAINILLPVTVK